MFEMTMQTSLVYSAILTFAMFLTAAAAKGRYWTMEGMIFGMGNRDTFPVTSPLAARADRAAKNMIEGMVLFGAVVIAAQGMGVSNESTTLGATLFFWSRVVYFPVYVAGIPWVRTGVWAVGLIGTVIIGCEAI
jgi:uncharacterized MAPEG superfamily protein